MRSSTFSTRWPSLRGLERVLKPGGRIVLRLPLDDWRAQRDQADDGNHHLYTWTPRLIANLLREAGFQVERAEVVTYAWPPRSAELVHRLPRRLFDLLARVTASPCVRRAAPRRRPSPVEGAATTTRNIPPNPLGRGAVGTPPPPNGRT